MALRDKTRRLWTLILFLILGPILLLTVLGLLFYRRGPLGVYETERSFSAEFHQPISLTDVEFVRPEIVAYYGLRIHSSQTGNPLVFCPEIYACPAQHESFSENFNAFWDFETESEGLKAEKDWLESLEIPEQRTERLWLIPDLYLDISENAPVYHSFSEILAAERPQEDAEASALQRGIAFRIRRIHLIRRHEEFNAMISQFKRPKKRFKREDDPFFQDEGENLTHEEGSDETIRRQVADYIGGDTFALERASGKLGAAKKGRFLAMAFRPDKITAGEKARLFLAFGQTESKENLNAKSLFFLDAYDSPLPTSLLALFLPIFSPCGESSWATGGIFIASDSSSEEKKQRVFLKDFLLRDGSLESLLGRLTTTRILGKVNRFSIQEGEIQDGIFLGKGFLSLTRGSLDKDFLVRLQKEARLSIQPTGMLNHRFPDNLVPYQQLAFGFESLPEGVRLFSVDSKRTGLAGFYESKDFRYQITLPSEEQPELISYPALLSTLADEKDHPFWTPFYRDALNHLPVPTP